MTQNDIDELNEIFKEAETNIKLAELDGNCQGFSMPAINELRYAFKHLTIYLKDSKIEEFTECKAHVKRATCDALEMRILTGLERIKRFDSRYRFVSISPIIPNWIDLRRKLEKAKELLASGDESKERIAMLKEALENVKDVLEITEIAKSELNKSLFKRFFSVAGTITAFFAACLTIYKFILG
jgi:ADP-dependent phosphofructokinase/glucokinase